MIFVVMFYNMFIFSVLNVVQSYKKKKRTHTHAHICWVHQGSVSLQIDFFSALSEIKSQRI